MSELGITIAGEAFPHLIYHFVLSYSNWETGSVCYSESFESLSEGLQQDFSPSANFLNFFTPGFVPQFDYHTDQFTFGINWYLNYWVKYQFNVNIDRLKQPSTTGQVPQNFYGLMQELQFRF